MARETAAVRLLAGDKEPVRLASTANLSLSGLLTVDGVVTVAGDRVLVKNQTAATANGIYTASVGAWKRAPDAASSRTIRAGMMIYVQEGTQAGNVWSIISDQPDIGTDSITFVLYLSLNITAVTSAAVAAAAASAAAANVSAVAAAAAAGSAVNAIIGPASATDNAAVRFDTTTGKLGQNSPLLIADTTGALSRSGGGGIAVEGRAGIAASAGYIGETKSSIVTIAGAYAISTGGSSSVWNQLALPIGCWFLGGNVGVLGTSGSPVFTHMHADHNATGSTSIQTSPGNGSTVAMHLTSNQSNGWIVPYPWIPYMITTPTTIFAVITADFTGGTAAAYGALWAVRIS